MNLFVFGLLCVVVVIAGFIACGVGLIISATVIQMATVWIYTRLQGGVVAPEFDVFD